MILLKMIYLKIIIVPAAMDAHPPFMKVRGLFASLANQECTSQEDLVIIAQIVLSI